MCVRVYPLPSPPGLTLCEITLFAPFRRSTLLSVEGFGWGGGKISGEVFGTGNLIVFLQLQHIQLIHVFGQLTSSEIIPFE